MNDYSALLPLGGTIRAVRNDYALDVPERALRIAAYEGRVPATQHPVSRRWFFDPVDLPIIAQALGNAVPRRGTTQTAIVRANRSAVIDPEAEPSRPNATAAPRSYRSPEARQQRAAAAWETRSEADIKRIVAEAVAAALATAGSIPPPPGKTPPGRFPPSPLSPRPPVKPLTPVPPNSRSRVPPPPSWTPTAPKAPKPTKRGASQATSEGAEA